MCSTHGNAEEKALSSCGGCGSTEARILHLAGSKQTVFLSPPPPPFHISHPLCNFKPPMWQQLHPLGADPAPELRFLLTEQAVPPNPIPPTTFYEKFVVFESN